MSESVESFVSETGQPIDASLLARLVDEQTRSFLEAAYSIARDWNEDDHPRAEDGKFSSDGGGSPEADLQSADNPSDKAEGGSSGSGGSGAVREGHLATKRDADGKLVLANGKPLPEHAQKMGIPPAWKGVTVAESPDHPLQVQGYDAKGRLQSVYSEAHSARQAAAKFERTRELISKMGAIRAENERNMRSKDPAVREPAAALALVQATGIRPGSERDTGADVQAHGATTLEGRHVVVKGDDVTLKFVGKKGVALEIPVQDRAVAAMVKERAAAAGRRGKLFAVTDAQLRDYAHTTDGGKFKPKDFRTARGTTVAHGEVQARPVPKNLREYKVAVRDVAKKVAAALGNTPAVALQSYIDPHVFSRWRKEAGA